MNVRPVFISALLLAGCAAAPRGTDPDVLAQLRALREEQARQSHQLELLGTRVGLAEDTAREARAATVANHLTVRIPAESTEPVTAHRTGPPTPPAAPRESGSGDDDAPSSPTPRPVIRITGRDMGTMPNGTPITVRPSDRLPVVPLPAMPEGIHPTTEMPAAPSVTPPPPPATTAAPSGALEPGAVPAYDAALALARGGHCAEAVDRFAAFLVQYPDHPYADHAMYWRGECILSQGDARRAAGEFEGLLARFPAGQKVADALYKLVGVYRRLGDAMRAEQYATRLLHDFPRSESAARLRSERNS